MQAFAEPRAAIVSCQVEVAPAPVDAGAPLTLVVTLVADPPADLRGLEVTLRDAEGAVVAAAPLVEFDGAASRTAPIVVAAPGRPGRHLWQAAAAVEGAATAEVALDVRAHATRVVVWDVPSSVEAGGRFRVKVGAKCAAGCDQTDRRVEIHAGGGVVTTARLGAEPWPGTALHAAEIELAAPAEPGPQRWRATLAAPAAAPDAEGGAEFGLVVTARPEARVVVTALDRGTGRPIPGARVVMHPHRGAADDAGRAELHVPRGVYTLFVSRGGYLTYREEINVDGDLRVEAALPREPPPPRE
jgi:hypothetical protein